MRVGLVEFRDHMNVDAPIAIALLVAGIVAFILNLMSITVLITNKKLQTLANSYQLSLSLCNVWSMAFTAWMHPACLLGASLTRNKTLKALTAFVEENLVIITVLSICGQGLERYLGLCRPLKARKTANRTRTYRIIFAIWLVAIVGSLPHALCDEKEIELAGLVMYNSTNQMNFSTSVLNISLTDNSRTGSHQQDEIKQRYDFCNFHSKLEPYMDFAFLFWVPLFLYVALFCGIVRQLRRRVSNITEHAINESLPFLVRKIDKSLATQLPVATIITKTIQEEGLAKSYNLPKYETVAQGFIGRRKAIKRVKSDSSVPCITAKEANPTMHSYLRHLNKEKQERHLSSAPDIHSSSWSTLSVSTTSKSSSVFENISQSSEMPSIKKISLRAQQNNLEIPAHLDVELTSSRKPRASLRPSLNASSLQKGIFACCLSKDRNSVKNSTSKRERNSSLSTNRLSTRKSASIFTRNLSNRCYTAVFPNASFEFIGDVETKSLNRSIKTSVPCTGSTGLSIRYPNHLTEKLSTGLVAPKWLWRCRMRAVRNLGLVISVFVLEWLPFHLMRSARVSVGKMGSCVVTSPQVLDRYYHDVIGLEICVIAILNPVIHCICSKRFFRACLQLLRHIVSTIRCKRTPSSTIQS